MQFSASERYRNEMTDDDTSSDGPAGPLGCCGYTWGHFSSRLHGWTVHSVAGTDRLSRNWPWTEARTLTDESTTLLYKLFLKCSDDVIWWQALPTYTATLVQIRWAWGRICQKFKTYSGLWVTECASHNWLVDARLFISMPGASNRSRWTKVWSGPQSEGNDS